MGKGYLRGVILIKQLLVVLTLLSVSILCSSCKFDLLGDPPNPTITSYSDFIPPADPAADFIDSVLDIPVCYDHGLECNTKRFSSFSAEEGSALKCRMFTSKPNETKVFTHVIDYYTNCGTCYQAALQRIDGQIPLDVDESEASKFTCDIDQVIEDIELVDGWSYQVITLMNGSNCRDEFPVGKIFSFPSALSAEGDGEDTCFPVTN